LGPSGRTERKTASRNSAASVEEQRRQLDVVEVAALKRLEALAQLLADARGGRLRQLPEPRLLAQRLDVAHRQTPDERADHQRLERLRPDQLGPPREQLRGERLGRFTDLRDLDLELSLRGLQRARAKTVAQPAAIVAQPALMVGPALIARSAQPGVELVLHSPLDDQSRPPSRASSDNDSRGFSPTPTESNRSICPSISADGGTVRLTA
jgi:hypothetical protein